MLENYTKENLIWTKNVKRQQGNGWAYMDVPVGGNFYLNWSKRLKSNVSKPKFGELILIFQTINSGHGYPKGTYLTHIVTPLSNDIQETDSTHPYIRLMGCVAKAYLPKPASLNFFKPNRGACCDITLIERINKEPLSKSKLQESLWDLFKVKSDLKSLFDFVISSKDDIDDDVVIEGREKILIKEHKFYERSSVIIHAKKKNAKIKGELFCEVCDFDFNKFYPNHGNDFIECHHKFPIAKGGPRETRLSDLALVCSNCHRMLHRKNMGKYLTIDELGELINKDIFN